MTEINGIELDLDKIPSDVSRGMCGSCGKKRGTKNLNDKCVDCGSK